MKRHLLKTLNQWKTSKIRKPLVLRGARQVGKTYLLKIFAESSFDHHLYVNFEEDERLARIFEPDLKPSRILNELQLYLDHSIDLEHDLLILDEIQRCPRALTSLKYFCEDLPELAVCTAGSLLGVSLNQGSFPVGKICYADLHPMSFEEFLEGIGKTRLLERLTVQEPLTPLPELSHEQLWEIWKHYLIVGGLPEAVNTYRQDMSNLRHTFQAVRRTQADLIDTYLADIAKHCGKMNALHIERLWRNAPAQLARTQDGSAPKFRFKNVIPGVNGYERLSAPLGWLERADLLIRTSIIGKPTLPLAAYAKENFFKLYFFDVGLLGAISDIKPAVLLDYDFGSYKGYVAENYVAQALRATGQRDLHCWQGRTSEVEFLLSTDQGVIPIEVKSGRTTQSKSLSVYAQRFNPKKAYVVSAKNYGSKSHRTMIPLYAVGHAMRRILVSGD